MQQCLRQAIGWGSIACGGPANFDYVNLRNGEGGGLRNAVWSSTGGALVVQSGGTMNARQLSKTTIRDAYFEG